MAVAEVVGVRRGGQTRAPDLITRRAAVVVGAEELARISEPPAAALRGA